MFLTLHDMWTFTGHCGYSLGCERWRLGCGECPDLTLYPPVDRDGTAFNLSRKREIYRRSRLRVATPSRWLLEKAKASALWDGVAEARVIPYGVDLRIFQPGNRAEVRGRLGIRPDARVLLFAAHGGKGNPYKDYDTVHEAVSRIGSESRENNSSSSSSAVGTCRGWKGERTSSRS